MNQAPTAIEEDDDDGPSLIGLVVAIISVITMGVFWSLNQAAPNFWWVILFLFTEVIVISIVIWQACDPFADVAQWIGDVFQVPGSVRGATLDAIASSMPELFCGIFFVLVAISVAGDSEAALLNAGAEGYGSTIATCAGSAVYNMILIPAACAIFISFYRKNRPTIDVDDEVISRDGMWFVGCEMLLILFLFQDAMQWWMAITFLGLYCVYVVQLFRDAKRYRYKLAEAKKVFEQLGAECHTKEVVKSLSQNGVRISHTVVVKARQEFLENSDTDDSNDNDESTESVGLFFGYVNIPLNHTTAWPIIIASTIVAATACYFLVEVTRQTAAELAVPTFFVAVILAAAASSVPDTFLSIGSAMRGDDSGAVSNAFGSNIFDICICLSIPLLVNSYLTGWQPVSLLQDGEPIAGLTGLRILLVVLTLVTLAIIWHNRQLTRNKAFVLCGLYGIFILYAVLGSLGIMF